MAGKTFAHMRRHVVAYVAVLLALGGTSAYAAFKLPKNSVGTKQLKNGAVTLKKISGSARSALRGAKGPQGIPGNTGPSGATNLTVRAADDTALIAPGATSNLLTVNCPTGSVATGGGVWFQNDTSVAADVVVLSNPVGGSSQAPPTGWEGRIHNGDTVVFREAQVQVVCASP